MITTLSPDLTTPVPPPLAKQFNLRPGAQLDWQADKEGIVIHVKVATPTRLELAERLHELGAKHKRGGDDPVADLIRERIAEDELRQGVLE
jgi:hypothetical protein